MCTCLVPSEVELQRQGSYTALQMYICPLPRKRNMMFEYLKTLLSPLQTFLQNFQSYKKIVMKCLPSAILVKEQVKIIN